MNTFRIPGTSSASGAPVESVLFEPRRGERVVLTLAMVAALTLHGLFLIVRIPIAPAAPPPVEKSTAPGIWIYPLPPPPIRPLVQREQPEPSTRRLPVPLIDPVTPGPVNDEPYPEPGEVSLTALADGWGELPLAHPVAPEPAGPRVPGADVTSPILIQESKVEPDYPEVGRVARREADVILQAVVRADGTVGDVKVLQCDAPGFGFEAAAAAAVRQWVYEPGTWNGRAVDVYFTVFVTFRLR